MALWSKKKALPSQINGGMEYIQGDDMSIDQLNAMINNAFYSTDFVEALTNAPDVSEAGKVGTPTVTLVNLPQDANGRIFKRFKFSYLKGEKGNTGDYVELRRNGDYIQWKKQSDTTWQNLLPLADIKGDRATSVTLRDGVLYVNYD